MLLKLVRQGDRRVCLAVERRYDLNRPVVSLGCDCHAAWVLRRVHLRTASLPFDWVSTHAPRAVRYVVDNLNDGFAGFLADLRKNDRGHVVAGRYPGSEFMHAPDLIENPATRATLRRRADRFVELVRRERCTFLLSLSVRTFRSREDVAALVDAVHDLHAATGGRHRLLAYLRHEESEAENEPLRDSLEAGLRFAPQTTVVRYVLGRAEHGNFGNEADYPALLESFDAGFRRALPRVYLKRVAA